MWDLVATEVCPLQQNDDCELDFYMYSPGRRVRRALSQKGRTRDYSPPLRSRKEMAVQWPGPTSMAVSNGHDLFLAK